MDFKKVFSNLATDIGKVVKTVDEAVTTYKPYVDEAVKTYKPYIDKGIEIYNKIEDDLPHYKYKKAVGKGIGLYKEIDYILQPSLIPKLSEFFDPINYDHDKKQSYYLIGHTNNRREDTLEYLGGIIGFYSSFKNLLTRENKTLLDKTFETYKTRDLTRDERASIKKAFYFQIKNLQYLENANEQTFYAENSVLKEIWDKIVAETEEYSELHLAKFSSKVTKDKIILSVKQSENSTFNFKKFIESNKTLSIYKQIRNYGNIFITSEWKELNILTSEMKEYHENNTTIRIELEYKAPVRKGSSKR